MVVHLRIYYCHLDKSITVISKLSISFIIGALELFHLPLIFPFVSYSFESLEVLESG